MTTARRTVWPTCAATTVLAAFAGFGLAWWLKSAIVPTKDETLKITDDAVHLLAGIGHDGKDGAWTFTGFRLVDLSSLQVRLKAEFQASNADLYHPGP